MTDLIEMTKLFSVIKSKKDDITEIEKIIKVDFNQNVINFFKEKGFEFTPIDNQWDVIKRYRLPKKEYPNFLIGWSNSYNYFPPQFDIKPWEFRIKFVWKKNTNLNSTEVYWHPEEMPLENFYNKKLKKVFNLI